jgi:2-dehydro-3-deoxyphosphogluconate aldolase/(4S)-4-hydroxy-2-oxoglutarate aldolase
MNTDNINVDMYSTRVVPVVVLDSEKQTNPLCDALVSAGQATIEITLRTPAGIKAIEIAASRGDMIVGAGTVTSVKQVQAVKDAGAVFLVSPGFDPKITETALDLGLKVLQGCVTPSEIMAAMKYGLKTLKFFPADIYGGPKTLKSLSAVFGDISFVPTGGVSLENMNDYLALPSVKAIGGSWMVKKELINNNDFSTIHNLTNNAIKHATQN